MAENDDVQDERLDISDDDAERLLADDDDDDRNGRSDRDGRRDGKGRGRDKDSDSDSEDDEELGAPGRRALEAMKEQRKAARVERDRARQELDDLRKKLEKFEGANKSELQRLQEAAQSNQTRAEKAEAALRRREIAEQHAPAHASAQDIAWVAKRLSGDDDEALEDDAADLFARIAPEPAKSRTPSRPKERLRGGGDPDEESEENDPRKLAELIRKNR